MRPGRCHCFGRIDGGTEENLYAVLQDFVPADHRNSGETTSVGAVPAANTRSALGKADESVKADGRWLYKKACLFAFASEFVDIVTGLDDLENENLSEDELIAATIFDGSALDVALFEGGIFAEFLARRSELLPEAEVVTATVARNPEVGVRGDRNVRHRRRAARSWVQ